MKPRFFGTHEFMQPAQLARVCALAKLLRQMPPADLPLVHRFTPGLYVREIFMPKGALVISKVHKTEHPFVISKGHAAVWTPGEGVQQLKAPYCGITKPGTCRVLFIHEDCVWTTFHPTGETNVEVLENTLVDIPDAVPQMSEAELRALKLGPSTINQELSTNL